MRYYVAPNGTGFNTNLWNTPGFIPGDLVTTVNQIIANPSRGGDEIWAAGNNNVIGALYQGFYNLAGNPLVINQNREPLSIYGGFVGTERTLCDRNANIVSNDPANFPDFFQNPSILDGGGTNRVIEMQGANVFLIDGFVVRNGDANQATGRNGGGVHVFDSNIIRFENMVFMDNVAGHFGGGLYMESTRNVIVNNTIFFNNDAVNPNNGGGGFCIVNCYYIKLVNLLFNANTGNGAAAFIVDSNNVILTNSTLAYNNVLTATSSHLYCLNANLDMYNSILYPDRFDILPGQPQSTINVDYCLLSNNIPFANLNFNNQNGLFFVNPNFVNPAARNFHLQPVSPCIDTGNADYIFPLSATDLEGKPRFINNTAGATTIEVDMGAFEVQ